MASVVTRSKTTPIGLCASAKRLQKTKLVGSSPTTPGHSRAFSSSTSSSKDSDRSDSSKDRTLYQNYESKGETSRESVSKESSAKEYEDPLSAFLRSVYPAFKPSRLYYDEKVLGVQEGGEHSVTIGIRREDPARIWERRCPLTPNAVYELVRRGHRVVIEPCERRVWGVDEFSKAGAKVDNNLRDAHIIVGIKETPLNELVTSAVPRPGLKSTSSHRLEDWRHRTHVMFSHTAKGQPYNTGLLARFLGRDNYNYGGDVDVEKSGLAGRGNGREWIERLAPRLIDYELLTDEEAGKRTVGFGWFAGVAGVLEALSSMAHAHLEIGVASPFLYTPRPHTQPSLDALRRSLRSIGDMIKENGTPRKLGPFIIGLTGNGNVSKGCLSMLEELPIHRVKVKNLPALVNNPDTRLDRIYLVHASPEEYLTKLDGGKYNREHYYSSPQSYRSDFAEKVAPYLTLFLNGTGWQPSFPRLMTNSQLEAALHRAQAIGGARFTNIGDISCDIEGGLEFMTRSSTISSPFYKIQPVPSLPPVQIMSVDILPATIPLDASKHFSEKFFPYLEALIEEYASPMREATTGSEEDECSRERKARLKVSSDALSRATIAQAGELMGPHKWLKEGVDKWREANATEARMLKEEAAVLLNPSNPVSFRRNKETTGETTVNRTKETALPNGPLRKKKMLMLGSGMVAGPAVDEIAKRADVQLVIASNSLREVEKLTENHLNVKYRLIDMSDLTTVSELIREADVVISLLPASLHPKAADLCIEQRKHLVTASYISPEMQALHQRALDADVLLLNEIGLDPGIDHCSAISLIERLKLEDKKIMSFISFCGGLPAPDVPHVPLRYKFSWSPRGVLTAALNSARYKLNNTIWNIPGDNILKSYFPDIPITGEFDLEGIANRDSLPYLDTYNLGPVSDIRTVLRGTLRYPGFSKLMDSFKMLGLLETQKQIFINRWSSLVPQSVALKLGVKFGTLNTGEAIKTLIPSGHAGALYSALEWLSLLPQQDASAPLTLLPTMPNEKMAPIDLFSILLAHKLKYKPGERDMVIMSHEIIARPNIVVSEGEAGRAKEEIHTSKLIVYGDERASAMARTVGLPVAFAALRVIDGEIPVRGVAGPGDASVYRPILSELERVGLGMQESMRYVAGGEPPIERALLPVSF